MILIAVVLLAALTYVVAKPGGEQATSSSANRIAEEIKSQAQSIRSAILECNLVHNYGYPAQPVSGLAKDLQCQIDDTPTMEAIFTGTSNRFMPQPPLPFTDGWAYTVDSGTAPPTITISLSKAGDCTNNAALKAATDMLANQYTAQEATITCNGATTSFLLYIVKGS